jgi:two-component system cell cycle sensor histidine kinase/response regulator CckA
VSAPLRVLLIEDSADDAELLLRMLRQGGYEPQSSRVQTEEELLAALESGAWDLVVADHSLPRLPSSRALEMVRARDLDIPFLVVSGTIREQDAVDLMKSGASDYLLKDRLTRLVPAVRRELEEARLRREHRRAQAEIERAQARYRSLIDNAVVGVYRSGASGRFTFVNQALVSMLGYASGEEVLRLDPAAEVFADRADLERLGQVGSAGKIEGVEVEWRRRDGRPLHVRLWGRVVAHSETPHGLEMFVENVSELRLLQRSLEQAQKMEAVGRLAGGIAHDFNNLLVAILGYADVLKTTTLGEEKRAHCVDEIQKAGERAAALTRQLLSFSRRQVLDRAVLNLNAVVRDVEAMLSRLIGADVVLRTSLQAGLVNVVADRGQVEQVLLNLAVNARDAMPRGGDLLIETRVVTLTEPMAAVPRTLPAGRWVRLTVSDTGEGMSEEVKAHLFEPFYTTKERGKGTGLGLSMVYGIVTQSDGALTFVSEPGVGTRFDLWFPPTEREVDGGEKGRAEVRESSESVARGGETLLFVEDDPAVCALATEILRIAGFHVLPAATAAEALAALDRSSGPVHALVTDVVLPDMSGIELAERVHAMRPMVRILFTSGYTSESVDIKALSRAHAAFLQKPFRTGELVAKIRAVLDEVAPARPPAPRGEPRRR